MKMLGVQELLIIFAIFILLFGGKKLGEVAKGMGEGIREWKKAMKEGKDVEKEIKA